MTSEQYMRVAQSFQEIHGKHSCHATFLSNWSFLCLLLKTKWPHQLHSMSVNNLFISHKKYEMFNPLSNWGYKFIFQMLTLFFCHCGCLRVKTVSSLALSLQIIHWFMLILKNKGGKNRTLWVLNTQTRGLNRNLPLPFFSVVQNGNSCLGNWIFMYHSVWMQNIFPE